MSKKAWKPVPPTKFYLSKRAEWFRIEAKRAQNMGDLTRCQDMMKRAREYAILAGQLELDTEGQDEQLHRA